MDVSVAICTWNRAELLDCTLASLAEVFVPPHIRLRVIVADNNSTDDTARIVERHERRLPLQRLFVKKQGKSNALNAVLERLQGDLVLWTDDDVLFDRHWLTAYVDAAERNPHVGFFGGKIVPHFLGGEPQWLRPAWRYAAEIFADRDFGDEPLTLDQDRLPYGANWAVRVPLQKRYLYKQELGRNGDFMLSGEETDVALRFLADGHIGLWVPDSTVEHLITPERVTVEAVWRNYFVYALSNGKQASSRAGRALCGAWHTLLAWLTSSIGAWHGLRRQHALWMKYIMYAACSWGHVETQWRRLPERLKPSPLRRLLKEMNQPRYSKSLAPLIAAGWERHRAKQPPSLAVEHGATRQLRAA